MLLTRPTNYKVFIWTVTRDYKNNKYVRIGKPNLIRDILPNTECLKMYTVNKLAYFVHRSLVVTLTGQIRKHLARQMEI